MTTNEGMPCPACAGTREAGDGSLCERCNGDGEVCADCKQGFAECECDEMAYDWDDDWADADDYEPEEGE